MTGWHEGPLLAFDTETTGVDPHTVRIVQVGLALIQPESGAQQHLWLIDPGVDIPDSAAAVHGISTEKARADGERPRQVLEQVRDRIVLHLSQGWPLIAFNAAYDCTLLEAELHRHGLETVTQILGQFAPVIDPLVLHTKTSRIVSRKLGFLCEHYGVRLDQAHDAGADALAAARLAWRLAQINPRLANTPPLELHRMQQQWRREQCDAKRAEYDGLGWTHDGWNADWPVRQQAVPA